jgi:ABC-2 type transport system ATP-binding protein
MLLPAPYGTGLSSVERHMLLPAPYGTGLEPMPEPVISVRGLRKSYGELEAVRGIDLDVDRREIFAFLGPNGAGKTTTVEVLEGYRERSSGEVRVLGVDPAHADHEWRQRIGIVLQESRMHPELTVRESIELFAGYYRAPRGVDETVELVGLTEKADERVARLSGGQQRRLDVALALIGDPELLFLDEPTTGFDPSARRRAWEVVTSLRELGKTIFLTTHYMEEAQELADRVAIIAGGRIVAEGTPQELTRRDQRRTTIRFRLPDGVAAGELPVGLVPNSDGAVAAAGEISVQAADPVRALNALTSWALERGIPLDGLEVRQPNLEDVYLELTEAEEVAD